MGESSEQAALGRRAFLRGTGVMALGSVALDALLAQGLTASTVLSAGLSTGLPAGPSTGTGDPAARRYPHFTPKAKRVIFLTQSGGPSQLELFDPKPGLVARAGQPLPESVRGGQRVTGMTRGKPQLVLPSRATFRRRGACGMEISDWIPHIGSIADKICLVRSMVTEEINHAPAMTKFLTGNQLPGRPSIGSWASYGLGRINQDLPSYAVLITRMMRGSDQPLYDHYWGNGFLPASHQGVRLRSSADPVLYLDSPPGVSRGLRRAQLDGLGAMNRLRHESCGDPAIAARIEQYEVAIRMQASVAELADLADETDETMALYGPDARRPGSYAANCILARRMMERGVRFVQLFHPDWDHHSRLTSWCQMRCRDTDQPTAALIVDLERRGLLDDTLVVWGGEFGRSTAGQGDWRSLEAGRDHHPRCFSLFLAGAGIRAGTSFGATDEFGFNVVQDPVHVRDLHATILHLMGIRHGEMTVKHRGLDMRLTGVDPARVVREILA